MAHRTGAEELVDKLALAGVERIYGIMGDSLNAVPDAIRRSGKLKWVHVHHEETVAFAAGAEAQLSGRLAACAGSCGPDNLHLIHALPGVHRSMAPVIAIAAHILRVLRDTNGMIGGRREPRPSVARPCSIAWRSSAFLASRSDSILTPVDDFRHRLTAQSFRKPPSQPASCRSWPHAAYHRGVAQGRFQSWHGPCSSDGNDFPRHIEEFKRVEAQLNRARGDKDADDLSLLPSLIPEATRGLQDDGVKPDICKIEDLDRCESCMTIVETARSGGRDNVGGIVLGRGADDKRVARRTGR